MNRFIVIHTFKYGNEEYFFETERDLYEELNVLEEEEQEEYARNIMGINFELNCDESLNIINLSDVEFKKIPTA